MELSQEPRSVVWKCLAPFRSTDKPLNKKAVQARQAGKKFMPRFEYEFQFSPNDLKSIRDFSGIVRFSPATSITVWSIGFTVCLLILGAIGYWSVLWMLMFSAIIFVSWYVKRLNRRSFADREYFVRSIALTDAGVIEKFGDSMFEKSWDAFEEFAETPEHFFLRHFEKITTVPKRVVPADELDDCREFLEQQTAVSGERTVAKFSDWFCSESRFPVYSFRWSQSDVDRLAVSRLVVYDRTSFQGIATHSLDRLSFVVAMLILFAVGLMIFFNSIDPNVDWLRALLFPVAIAVPFVVALAWWKYTSKAARKTPRIPDEDIFVTLSESDLLIGYPKAVAKYSWNDINTFYYSDNFIGFRHNHGLIHVVANHAFGGTSEAIEFLRMADQLADQSKVATSADHKEPQSDMPTMSVEETGNPFQPPSYLS